MPIPSMSLEPTCCMADRTGTLSPLADDSLDSLVVDPKNVCRSGFKQKNTVELIAAVSDALSAKDPVNQL